MAKYKPIHQRLTKWAAVVLLSSMAIGARAQTMFKLNNYYIYYNEAYSPVGTIFTNHAVSPLLSINSYFYVNASENGSWGEGLAGFSLTPLKGMRVGFMAGGQSNADVPHRIAPFISVKAGPFQYTGVFEFGGKRYRWDNMAFYCVDRFKIGLETIRYYDIYFAGPRAELTLTEKYKVTLFYTGLYNITNKGYAAMGGIYATFF